MPAVRQVPQCSSSAVLRARSAYADGVTRKQAMQAAEHIRGRLLKKVAVFAQAVRALSAGGAGVTGL